MQGSSSKNIVSINSEDDFDKYVLKNPEPVIVDFYADWCGPCKKLGPLLEKACSDNKTFVLAKINVDNNRELSEEYKVTGITQVMLFHCGKEIQSFTGLDVNQLATMIEKTKTLSKNRPFGGTGTVLDSSSQIAQEEFTGEMAEVFSDLENSLPAEPNEGEDNVYTIVIKFNDSNFKRRYSGDDKIEHLKTFAKAKIQTLKDVELFEPFPRKVYSDDSALIKSSGLSKNQILMAKLI